MKIVEGFVLREIKGQGIVVAIGKKTLIFNGMIRLNEIGTIIWKSLAEGHHESEIVEAVLEQYEIDQETVEKDMKQLLERLIEAGIVEK